MATHNDLTTHFAATAGPSAPQFGQPLFMATSTGLLLTAAVPTMLTPHHLSNLTSQQIPALHQFGQPSTANLPPTLHSATQFLSNHNGFPFAVATGNSVPIAQNTTPMSTAHFLSKSDTNAALLNSITMSKAQQSTILQTTIASSLPITTSTTALIATTTTTPMAIINPQKNLQNGPPPLAPAFPTTIPIGNSLITQTTNGSFIANTIQTRDSSTSTMNNFLQPKPLIDQTPSHGTAIAVSVTKRVVEVAEATIPTINATAPLSTPITIIKRDTKIVSTVASLPSPKSAIPDNIQQRTTDEKITIKEIIVQNVAPSTDVIGIIKETKDTLKIQTIIESEQVKNIIIESAKSPILSQPKTIRFPANDTRNGIRRPDGRITGTCYWDECKIRCDSSSNLHDHLQTQHVNTQTGPFTCNWADCRVKGRESCSRKWLERHVLSHGGSKVYKCIFEKCRMRFGSQVSEIKLFITTTKHYS